MTDEHSGEVLLYQRDEGAPALEVRLDGETVWLSQQQIAELFQTSQQNVSLHVRNIYEEGEPEEGATHKGILSVRREGTREVRRAIGHYKVDAIISVGYRVKSKIATHMNDWPAHLDRLVVVMVALTQQGAVGVRHSQARSHAEAEYAKLHARLDAPPTEVEEAYLGSVKRVLRDFEGKQ